MTHTLGLKRLMMTLALFLSISGLGFAQLYDAVVAKDGSGDYYTIQDAILSIRDYKPEGRQRILVKRGVYEEKLVVPTYKTNISLIGEDRDGCILRWHDHANLRNTGHFEGVVLGSIADAMGNDKHLVNGSDRGHRMGTFESYTLLVLGEGFECENMTIENDAMTHHNPGWWQTRSNKAGVGQAVTVHCEADRSVFRNCKIHGFQDTIFTGNGRSRQIYYGCYIDGTVDFIFGPATAWFEDCEIHSIGQGYLTAASTPAENPYGYVFKHCRVTADPKADRVFLGRPWRNYANVIFMECELPSVIPAVGWNNWGDPKRELTARYAEYKNTGAGANVKERAAWSRQLTDAEAQAVTLEHVMHMQASQWTSDVRPVSFDQAIAPYYHIATGEGVPYVGATLEPKQQPADPVKAVEPLVINLKEVDCTTFVEYVTAAMLGRVAQPSANDSILQRFVQALRYRDGKRGNYASRLHYLSEWIAQAEANGLLTEVTAQLPGARQQKKTINFMSANTKFYPQLAACPALLPEIKQAEALLSAQTTYIVSIQDVAKASAELQHGDIVAFVTSRIGLDIQHVGFVWCPDGQEPHLLHASSDLRRVVISDLSLADYAKKLKGCAGIRVVRVNKK